MLYRTIFIKDGINFISFLKQLLITLIFYLNPNRKQNNKISLQSQLVLNFFFKI